MRRCHSTFLLFSATVRLHAHRRENILFRVAADQANKSLSAPSFALRTRNNGSDDVKKRLPMTGACNNAVYPSWALALCVHWMEGGLHIWIGGEGVSDLYFVIGQNGASVVNKESIDTFAFFEKCMRQVIHASSFPESEHAALGHGRPGGL